MGVFEGGLRAGVAEQTPDREDGLTLSERDAGVGMAEIETAGIGRMEIGVADPLGRSWERGVHMGRDSTHPDNPDPEQPSHR